MFRDWCLVVVVRCVLFVVSLFFRCVLLFVVDLLCVVVSLFVVVCWLMVVGLFRLVLFVVSSLFVCCFVLSDVCLFVVCCSL